MIAEPQSSPTSQSAHTPPRTWPDGVYVAFTFTTPLFPPNFHDLLQQPEESEEDDDEEEDEAEDGQEDTEDDNDVEDDKEMQEPPRPRCNVAFLLKHVQPAIRVLEGMGQDPIEPEFEVQDPNPSLQGSKARLSKELRQRHLASIGYLSLGHDVPAPSLSVCVELRDLRGSYVAPPQLFPAEERLCDSKFEGFLASGFRSFVNERSGAGISWGTDADVRAKIVSGELEGEQAELAAAAIEHRHRHKARWILPDATTLEPTGDTRSLVEVFNDLAHAGHAQTLQQGATLQKFSIQLIVQPR